MGGLADPDERVPRYVEVQLEFVAARAATRVAALVGRAQLGPAAHEQMSHMHERLAAPLVVALEQLGVPEPMLSAVLVSGVLNAATQRIEAGVDPETVSATALRLVRQDSSEPRAERVFVDRYDGDGRWRRRPDTVLGEEPLEIHVDGQSVATTMRTPGDDWELAIGFCWSEGWISPPPAGALLRHGLHAARIEVQRRHDRPRRRRPLRPGPNAGTAARHDRLVVRHLRHRTDPESRGPAPPVDASASRPGVSSPRC